MTPEKVPYREWRRTANTISQVYGGAFAIPWVVGFLTGGSTSFLPYLVSASVMAIPVSIYSLRRKWIVSEPSLRVTRLGKPSLEIPWNEISSLSRSSDGSSWWVASQHATIQIPDSPDTHHLLSEVICRVHPAAIVGAKRRNVGRRGQRFELQFVHEDRRKSALFLTVVTMIPFLVVGVDLWTKSELLSLVLLLAGFCFGVCTYLVPLWKNIVGRMAIDDTGIVYRRGNQQLRLNWDDVKLVEFPMSRTELVVIGDAGQVRVAAKPTQFEPIREAMMTCAPRETPIVGAS